MQQDLWFPLDGSQKTSGRFIDHSYDYTGQDGIKKLIHVTALQSKATGSDDESFQPMKPHNRELLIKRCPAGWAHYEKLKARAATQAAPEAESTLGELGIKGHPIEDAALHCNWNNDRLRWFKQQGIMVVEQVADLSDMACQNLGRGALQWRKKAKEFLASASTSVAA